MKLLGDFSISEKAFDLAERIWAFLYDVASANHLEFILAAIILGILIILTASIAGFAFTQLTKALTSLLQTAPTIGLTFHDRSQQSKRIRRRSQFCAVLDSDLAYLAKTENWNDQFFTDLEADVEMEGGYYRSFIARWLGRKSRGLRRESSLVRAIDASAERVILLVGEPGSGKSVALRHLAKQLTYRTKHSRKSEAPIPLYVNLRELIVADLDEVNADTMETAVSN